MSHHRPVPTPHPDVNAVLRVLLARVQHILAEHFVGMYLYGSLTGDDFDPASSDIDFLVVVREEVRGSLLDDLSAMHADLFTHAATKWARELEGSYIPEAALRCHDPTNCRHPHIDRGSGRLAVEQHDVDWIIQRYVLREQGIVLTGPPLTTLIDPVTGAHLREAVRELMAIWWEPMSRDTGPLMDGGYRSYAVLSMCRILYTWQHGTVISKSKAAEWAQQHLDPRWASLIAQAQRFRSGTEQMPTAAVQAFIRYIARQMRPD